MTAVYITIDTEYSGGLAVELGRHARAEVYARSIAGRTAAGDVGIEYQMDMMDAHGIAGVDARKGRGIKGGKECG